MLKKLCLCFAGVAVLLALALTGCGGSGGGDGAGGHPPGAPPTLHCEQCHNNLPPGFQEPAGGIEQPPGHPTGDCTLCHGPNAIVPGL